MASQKVKAALGNVRAGSGLPGYKPAANATNYARNQANLQKQNQIAQNAQASALGAGNSASSAFPWDASAQGRYATAQASRATTNAQVAANRALGLAEFGLDEGFNDYKANPYSQAALLQHNHESNERGILTTAGQALYSGQTGNSQSIESNRFSQGHQELVNRENQEKAKWAAEEAAAKQAEEEAYWAAREEAARRAAEAYEPEVPVPSGNGGGGTPTQQGGGVVKKNKQGKKIGIGGARKA